MNYLKKQAALWQAIDEAYHDKPLDERNSEFKKLQELFAGITDCSIKTMPYSLQKTIEEDGQESADSVSELSRLMTQINLMCLKYGVQPVFPEAGSNAESDEILNSRADYLDQLLLKDRLLHDRFQEGLKTGNFENCEKYDKYVTDHIEEAIRREKGAPAEKQQDEFVKPDFNSFMDASMAFISAQEKETSGESVRKYIFNLNVKCGENDRTMYREPVIHQTLSCLIGKNKPNVLLIGAAGVGKTRIVRDIAGRLASCDPLIPEQLKGYSIWEFPLAGMVSGTAFRGELESRIEDILAFARDPENKVILFIDEIHMLAGGMSTYESVAQILKPALASGEVKVIGATTLQEAQNLMEDPAFNRRFTRLIVDELSQEQTAVLLRKEAGNLIEHFGGCVSIDDDQIGEIVTVADEYKTMGVHRPDNAITLLDRAMADAVMDQRKAGAQPGDDPGVIKLGSDRIRKTAMRIMTGNNERTAVDINALKKNLSVIRGQDEAVNYLIEVIRRDNLLVFPRKRPLTFLFAGSSGVGKTEVTKIIAETITGVKPIILNMTEFSSASSISRIVGAPSGYMGSNSKAELPFDILESNPYQVILLDEFEKCDRSVQRLFMSAFDEGYFNTAKGKAVDFTKSIIIATTNAGHGGEKKRIGFSFADDDANEASVIELSKYYDVELLNRFTKILNFRPISLSCYTEILENTYAREIKRIKSNGEDRYSSLPDNLAEEDAERLASDSYNAEFGARPAERTIQKYIEDLILSDAESAVKCTA